MHSPIDLCILFKKTQIRLFKVRLNSIKKKSTVDRQWPKKKLVKCPQRFLTWTVTARPVLESAPISATKSRRDTRVTRKEPGTAGTDFSRSKRRVIERDRSRGKLTRRTAIARHSRSRSISHQSRIPRLLIAGGIT